MTTTRTIAETTELISRLVAASQAYYLITEVTNDATAGFTMTDAEFDTAVEELREIDKSDAYPQLFAEGTEGYAILNGVLMGGTVTEDGDEIAYTSPMLSLDKATEYKQVVSFIERTFAAGATSLNLQAKYDGMAVAALYENGKLVRVSTRGDGKTGQNISHLINSDHVTIIGLPNEIPVTDGHNTVELRGELFFSNAQYAQVQENAVAAGRAPFVLSRSAVSGVVSRAKKNIDYDAEMTFVSYSAYVTTDDDEHFINSTSLADFASTGVKFAQPFTDELTTHLRGEVEYENLTTLTEVLAAVDSFGMIKNILGIPVDGAVIKPANEGEMLEKMGSTSRHPLSQIAWKYPGERRESVIRSIEPTVGRTGRITPVAQFDAVQLEGTITDASLHNYSIIRAMDVRVGSHVEIIKAGEIIPRVDTVTSNPTDTTPVAHPTHCPECSTKLSVSEDLMNIACPNEECPARVIASIIVAASREFLNIKGLSSSTIYALFNSGRIKDIGDVFSLTQDELAATEYTSEKGEPIIVGDKRAANILAEMEKAKKVKLEKILASLTIPGASHNTSKLTVRNFKTIDRILELTIPELAAVHGLGEVKATSMIEGLAKRTHIINKYREAGFIALSDEIQEEALTPVSTNVDVSGKVFVITGAVPPEFGKRADFEEYLELHGGRLGKSVSGSTDYVIGDATSSSSKMKKAIDLGIEIIASENFAERFMKS